MGNIPATAECCGGVLPRREPRVSHGVGVLPLPLPSITPGLDIGHKGNTLFVRRVDGKYYTATDVRRLASVLPLVMRCPPPARTGAPDNPLVPFSAPKLQGQLTLSSLTAVGTWEDLNALSGLRFHTIHLYPVPKCAPVLLAACISCSCARNYISRLPQFTLDVPIGQARSPTFLEACCFL